MKILLLYFLLLLGGFKQQNIVHKNDLLSGKVIRIVDGDTFDILNDSGVTMRIRINGIDCPERKQDYYQVCKNALADLIFGKKVTLATHGTDRYKRTIGDVYCDGRNIGLLMIEKGLAWQYKKYSSDAAMAAAEKRARHAKIGLWKNKNPVAPWDFRKYRHK